MVPNQNTLDTKTLTCAYWYAWMHRGGHPCWRGNECKYAHFEREGMKVAELPFTPPGSRTAMAGTNAKIYVQAQQQQQEMVASQPTAGFRSIDSAAPLSGVVSAPGATTSRAADGFLSHRTATRSQPRHISSSDWRKDREQNRTTDSASALRPPEMTERPDSQGLFLPYLRAMSDTHTSPPPDLSSKTPSPTPSTEPSTPRLPIRDFRPSVNLRCMGCNSRYNEDAYCDDCVRRLELILPSELRQDWDHQALQEHIDSVGIIGQGW
ncbi:hypothetical protein H2198_000773 [Neophaeococcomyces mojaviensis]|uniref:Uncharacterized protein n=1 Tax=Neophaeococcomyces mojaviensis TaxID=3383035 RepID=A0ACC3AIV5_9EURO|nr:hypothetical protein H2198_000773 [Knufia sp. JES_112]